MASSTITYTFKRYERAKQRQSNHTDRWERQAKYLSPSRSGITGKRSEGQKQTDALYDSTGLMAADLMAMFISGHTISPAQRWLGYTPADIDVKVDDQAQEWCEEMTDRTLRRVSESLFYSEGPECIVDYSGFGTGWLIGEEKPQPINRSIQGFRGFNFHAEKTGRFMILEGADGSVDTTFREFEMTARLIRDRWFQGTRPNNQAPMPENIRKALEDGDSKNEDKIFTIIHAIYPRPKAEQNGGYTATGMPWASCWIEKESKEPVFESGYPIFPVAAPRYHRTPGEDYGRGRGDLAFPDIWTLNTAKKMALEDWALKIKPPILHSHDGIFGTLRLIPGGPNAINTHGRDIRQSIMPWETGSNPEVTHVNVEELQRSINAIFYVQQILQLLEVNKSEMSAYEFAKKLELLFRIMGPVYGRFEWEFLYSIVNIMFAIQMQAGDFPPPPPSLQRGSGVIDIVFQNPIARAQRGGDNEALAMVMNDTAPLSQLFPQMYDRLDPDLLFTGVSKNRGLPAKWMRDDSSLKKYRDAKAEQQKQEMDLMNAEQAGKAASGLAPLLKVANDSQQAKP